MWTVKKREVVGVEREENYNTQPPPKKVLFLWPGWGINKYFGTVLYAYIAEYPLFCTRALK